MKLLALLAILLTSSIVEVPAPTVMGGCTTDTDCMEKFGGDGGIGGLAYGD